MDAIRTLATCWRDTNNLPINPIIGICWNGITMRPGLMCHSYLDLPRVRIRQHELRGPQKEAGSAPGVEGRNKIVPLSSLKPRSMPRSGQRKRSRGFGGGACQRRRLLCAAESEVRQALLPLRQARRGAARAVLASVHQEGWQDQKQICGEELSCRDVRRPSYVPLNQGFSRMEHKTPGSTLA